ncbi:MAG: cellulase family glycosylhydrolase [Muribaculaceae bacterium]|nr:cellulase family glycosylhydrolase [Muribaculaceae bacterium]
MRVKDFVLSGLFLFVALAFAACGEDKTAINTGWDSGALTVKDEVLLSGSNTQSLNIKATSKPTLTSDAEWLKIGEVKNLTTGIYTVELTAGPNVTGDTRTAKVTVVAGKETATITVTQVSGDLVEIRSIDPQGDLDPAGGTLTIKYVATGTPATNLPEWISVSGTRSLVDGELKLTYTPNNTGKEREGMIVLAVGKDGLANVTVRQPARTVAALSGRNAKQIAADMYAGVNIGNTMECPGKEGDWSMPVNEAYVAALVGMGFNAVRIPCAWDSHAADGVIDSAILDRLNHK